MTSIDAIRTFHADMIAIRRDLHAHPEIGMQERRTAGIVAKLLSEWGLDVHTGVGRTGVVGVLRRGEGPSIGLRADMDCLPMEEQTNLPWRSTNPGFMHACGHDGHTTVLLTAARQLAMDPSFRGTVNFIFQPSEERLGGTVAMLTAMADDLAAFEVDRAIRAAGCSVMIPDRDALDSRLVQRIAANQGLVMGDDAGVDGALRDLAVRGLGRLQDEGKVIWDMATAQARLLACG